MLITLTDDDLNKLKPATRADLIATLFAAPSQSLPNETSDYFWEDRVDLSVQQVTEFMEKCAPETIAGLRVIAEEGPVISAHLLNQVGIDNYGHFQGRTTKRARTITGNGDAYLLSWDDWSSEENQDAGCGHYAVTRETFQSLRTYFGLD